MHGHTHLKQAFQPKFRVHFSTSSKFKNRALSCPNTSFIHMTPHRMSSLCVRDFANKIVRKIPCYLAALAYRLFAFLLTTLIEIAVWRILKL